MDEPRQKPSNVPVYAVLLFGSALVFGCLAGWLGSALLWIVLLGATIGMIGALHYWMWGRQMQEQDEQEASR